MDIYIYNERVLKTKPAFSNCHLIVSPDTECFERPARQFPDRIISYTGELREEISDVKSGSNGQRAARAIEILGDLVAIESVNPYFPGGKRAEARMSEYLANFFRGLGLTPQFQEVLPGRSNTWAELKVAGARRTLLFDAHMDTVTLEPVGARLLEPRRENGRLLGRGSCDTKGSLAAMLAMFETLVEEPGGLNVNIIMLGSVDEEHKMRGIEAFAKHGPRIDAAIVGEPTELHVVIAHKGMTRWRLHTIGKTAHSSLPELGDNAIYQMITCVQEIVAAYEPILSSRSHPLLDKPTLTVNTIHGGTAVNIVPGSCVIEIDRRVLPNEDYAQITPELHRIVEGIQGHFPALNVEIEDPFEELPGIDTPVDSEIVQITTNIAGDLFGHRNATGVPYATDAGWLAHSGIPVVVLGPGDIAQAHTDDEFVEIAQVENAVELYRQIALEYPG